MDLNDLELLIKSPKDYILKYFNDSRETITALYKTRKETKLTNELSIKLDENYKLLTSKIDQLEKECLNNFSANKYDNKIKESNDLILETIHQKIEYFTNKYTNQNNDQENEEYDEYEEEYDPEYYILEKEIEDLIHATISSLEKIIFNNKTILFLEEEMCKIPNLFQSMDFLTTIGKLLIFKDKYFSRSCLSGITR
jgi:hypothetical protein